MKKLNFGCGQNILLGYVNADMQKHKDIISFDFNKFPYPFKDNTFDEVLAEMVIEHLENPVKVLKELHRISKPNGVIKIIVPYYNCRSALTDITHKHYFSDLTIKHLIEGYDYELNKEKIFKINTIFLKPTRLGKIIPFHKLRYYASLVIGEIYSEVYSKVTVIK